MAAGDPANAGANHTNMNTGAATTSSKTLAFATTAGNTLIAVTRLGTGRTVTAVDVSWDAGGTFPNAMTICGSHHAVASAGNLVVHYLSNITGAIANQTVIRVTADASTSIRWCVGEYSSALTLSGTETFADNGNLNAFNSGNRVLAGTSTLIGGVISGNNTAASAPWTGTVTNGLTWTIRDELDITAKAVTGLMDFNAGGQAAGTYACVGHFATGIADNVGSAIYSFTSAAATATPPPPVNVDFAVARSSSY